MFSRSSSRAEAATDVAHPPRGCAHPRAEHFIWLATAFWRTRASLTSWALLVTLITMQFTTVYVYLWKNDWQKTLFDSIQRRDGEAIPALILSFAAIIALTVTVAISEIFLYGFVAVRWRSWLNENYLRRWLERDRFFDIERAGHLDNPDQRIAEDLKVFTTLFLTTSMGLILAVTSVSSFVVVLWKLSSSIHIPLGSASFAIPGDLVWYAILYSVAGSGIVVVVGKPLVRRTMRQQMYEADYRFRLIHIRRNAEQIAFARSAVQEGRKLTQSFGSVYRNTLSVLRARMMLSTGQSLYGSIHDVLPILIVLPKYFAGGMTLGVLMQVRNAFEQLNSALSWFVQVYPTIAEITAVVNRIKALDDAIATPRLNEIDRREGGPPGLTVERLALTTPDGMTLLTTPDWVVGTGERWAIRGASGAGKSTLLRALAGLWPHGTGTVRLGGGTRMMFVPQKLYLPLGTLREALCFPDEIERFDPEACRSVLATCRLPKLLDRLESEGPWQDELSPGEQQRLAFARILLHQPELLFLDEATSALDPANATALYEAMLAELPGLTLVSVIHSDFLGPYHNRLLRVVDGVAQPVALPAPPCKPSGHGVCPAPALAV